MWYWLHKLQALPVFPLLVLYYAVRGIPFWTRCRDCGRRLLELGHLRTGLCHRCQRAMALAQSAEYYSREYYRDAPDVSASDHPGLKAAHDPLFKRVAQRIGEGRVLDVGCGNGYLLSHLHGRQERYGVDIAPSALHAARRDIVDGSFCAADARRIPFRSDSFDYLVCTEVIEHVLGDEVVRECYRVLRPDGVAVFTVPNGKGPFGESHPSHIRSFTFNSIRGYLQEAGFEVVAAQKLGLCIPFATGYLSVLSHLVGRNLPLSQMLNISVPELLAANFLVECQKPAS